MIDLAAIKARLAAATPGVWRVVGAADYSGDQGIAAEGMRSVLAECFADIRRGGENNRAEAASNAALIANAPADLAWLIGEVERLTALLADHRPIEEIW